MRILMVEDIDLCTNNGPKAHFLGLYQEFKRMKIITRALIPSRKILALKPYLFSKIIRYPLLLLSALKNYLQFRPNLIYLRASALMVFLIIPLKILNLLSTKRSTLILEMNSLLKEKGVIFQRNRFFSLLIEKSYYLSSLLSDKIIVVGERTKAELVAQGINPQKILVTENGVDLRTFRPIPRAVALRYTRLSPDFRYLGFVGQLKPWQGVSYLLKAFRHVQQVVPNLKLVIIGDGKERKRLEELYPDVLFLGEIDHSEIPYYINSFDVCCAPYMKSVDNYGSPLKIMEYAGCGKPIVAAKIESLPSIDKTHWPFGILFPPEDERALADAIIEILKDEERKSQIGSTGRRLVESYYSWQSVAHKIISFALNSEVGSRSSEFGSRNRGKTVIHILGASAFGGGVYYIQTLCQGLREKGFKVKILAENELVANYFKRERYPILTTKSFVREINPLKDLKALFRTSSLLRRERPDYVHTHTSKGGFIGRLAAKIARVPNIIHTVHGYAFHEYSSGTSRLFYSTLENLLLPFTTKIITMNDKDYEWTKEKIKGQKPKIFKIYNGINLAEIDSLKSGETQSGQDTLQADYFNFIFVGRLCSQKNLTCLLEAAAQLKRENSKNFRLLLIGADGGEERALRKMSDQLALNGTINFLGFRPRPETIRLLKSADCFILPSIYEGLSITLLEAGACGLPIIASNIKGNREVIKDGLTGLLFNPKDPKELKSKMEQVLCSFELRRELGLRIRSDIEKRFSIEKFLSETLKVYG